MRRPMVIIISATVLAVVFFLGYLLVIQGVFARVSSVTSAPAPSVLPEQAVSKDVPKTPMTDGAEPAAEQPVASTSRVATSVSEAEQLPSPTFSPRQGKMIAADYTAEDAAIAESLIFDANGMWRMDAIGPRLAIETASTPDERFSIAAQYVRDRYGSWAGAQAQALANNRRW